MDKRKSPRNTRPGSGNAASVPFTDSGLGMTATTRPTRRLRRSLARSPDALRAWCRQAERDAGERDGLTSEGTVRLKALERGNRELRQANGSLRKASAYSDPHPGDCRGNHLPGGGSEPDRPFRKGLPSLKSIRGTLRSGRPAVCCRSPQPPVTPMRPSPGILIRRQTGPGRMRQA